MCVCIRGSKLTRYECLKFYNSSKGSLGKFQNRLGREHWLRKRAGSSQESVLLVRSPLAGLIDDKGAMISVLAPTQVAMLQNPTKTWVPHRICFHGTSVCVQPWPIEVTRFLRRVIE